jgi:hypothetical protein
MTPLERAKTDFKVMESLSSSGVGGSVSGSLSPGGGAPLLSGAKSEIYGSVRALVNQLSLIATALESAVDGAGTAVYSNRHVAGDISVGSGDYWLGVTDTGSARTVTLPTAVGVSGRVFVVKDESGAAGTHNITLATQGSETIDGAGSLAISTNYGSSRVMSDGSDWFTF